VKAGVIMARQIAKNALKGKGHLAGKSASQGEDGIWKGADARGIRPCLPRPMLGATSSLALTGCLAF
jgi:hypothetical protein